MGSLDYCIFPCPHHHSCSVAHNLYNVSLLTLLPFTLTLSMRVLPQSYIMNAPTLPRYLFRHLFSQVPGYSRPSSSAGPTPRGCYSLLWLLFRGGSQAHWFILHNHSHLLWPRSRASRTF